MKQNYVNILLMLLRLRQACDHPLLVKGYNSNAKIASSIETVKKLPQEKQTFLLHCLEGSLAICGICNVSSFLRVMLFNTALIRGSLYFPTKKVVSLVLLLSFVVLSFYCGGSYLTLRGFIMLLTADARI